MSEFLDWGQRNNKLNVVWVAENIDDIKKKDRVFKKHMHESFEVVLEALLTFLKSPAAEQLGCMAGASSKDVLFERLTLP